jgi:hypothetical protein
MYTTFPGRLLHGVVAASLWGTGVQLGAASDASDASTVPLSMGGTVASDPASFTGGVVFVLSSPEQPMTEDAAMAPASRPSP